jgi:hypothetical protein
VAAAQMVFCTCQNASEKNLSLLIFGKHVYRLGKPSVAMVALQTRRNKSLSELGLANPELFCLL